MSTNELDDPDRFAVGNTSCYLFPRNLRETRETLPRLVLDGTRISVKCHYHCLYQSEKVKGTCLHPMTLALAQEEVKRDKRKATFSSNGNAMTPIHVSHLSLFSNEWKWLYLSSSNFPHAQEACSNGLTKR